MTKDVTVKEMQEHFVEHMDEVRRGITLRVVELEISEDVITRAGQSFGVPLKTLDALHLATAMAWRERLGEEVTFATHDVVLSNAARSMGFDVLGS
jgi:hypothetical protein